MVADPPGIGAETVGEGRDGGRPEVTELAVKRAPQRVGETLQRLGVGEAARLALRHVHDGRFIPEENFYNVSSGTLAAGSDRALRRG